MLVNELRHAVDAHDAWPTDNTSRAVINAARRLVSGIEMHAELIEQYRRHCTPTDEAIHKIFGDSAQ